MNNTDIVAKAYIKGEQSIIGFRNLFMPAPDECESAWFHYEWDKILRDHKGHFAIEAFRESAKSSIVSRAHLLWRLVYPKEETSYVCIIMANQKLAGKKLKEVADEYLTNPFFNVNLVKVKEQSEKAFVAIVKDKNGEEIEMRFEAYGKGSSIRGALSKDKRPQLILVDDPQDLEDSLSETIQDNDWEWFLSDVLFLGQHCRIFMIGNNLGDRCLIERVFQNSDELGFQTMKIPILDVKEESNWPAKWPVKDILDQKDKFRKLGKLDVWYREKMCVALAPDKQIFKKEMFRYYNQEDLPKNLSVFTTIDLAISEKLTADYSVICTIGVTEENHWMLLDIKYGRWNPSETMDNVFKTVQQYKPIFVGIEKVAYQAAFIHFLRGEMPKRNTFFTIKELIAERKKELRIQALQPRFTAGTVWFPMGAEFLNELETELMTFPKGLHDDLCDALAYMEQIASQPAGGFSKVNDWEIPIAGAC